MRSKVIAFAVLVATRAHAQEAPAPEPSPAPAPAPAPAPVPEPAPVVTPEPAPTPAATPSPAPVATPTPPAPANPTPHVDRPWQGWGPAPGRREFYVAFEVGHGTFGDPSNIYGDGLGRGLTIGAANFELHFEQYDLEDRSKMFTNVAHGDGIASITSLGYRFALLGGDRAAVTGLLGLSLLSRPSMIAEAVSPEEAMAGITSETTVSAQWGLGALVGAGIEFGGLLFADVRIYPAAWSTIAGTRMQYANNAAAPVAVTQDQSPGGMPVTVNAGIGFGF